ncbi:MAG: hypothetical protein HY352_05595 [Candidatus Omnitrophica bacterium]|nr:hypothetical protein [Candidatus Omnitrophota bacterium]
MKRASLVGLFCLVFATAALAKGGLQLEGTVTDVEVKEDTLSLLLTGALSFDIPTAPEDDPAREWRTLRVIVRQLPVRVAQWTVTPDPNRLPHPATFQETVDRAVQVATLGHVLVAGLDHPTISFSNLGEPLLIEGSRITVQDLTTLQAQSALPPSPAPTIQPPADRKSKKKPR